MGICDMWSVKPGFKRPSVAPVVNLRPARAARDSDTEDIEKRGVRREDPEKRRACGGTTTTVLSYHLPSVQNSQKGSLDSG